MENNYNLILEKNDRFGDNVLIDINNLNENMLVDNTIESIDRYTMNYTYDELIEKIGDENIVHDESYMNNSTLKIMAGDSKYRLDVVTKDMIVNYNLSEFIEFNIDNKDLMNTLYNKYNILDEESSYKFKEALENMNVYKVISMINGLDYLKNRKLNIYIIKKMLIKARQRELKAS